MSAHKFNCNRLSIKYKLCGAFQAKLTTLDLKFSFEARIQFLTRNETLHFSSSILLFYFVVHMEMLGRDSQLNSGLKIPLIGLGTAALPQNENNLNEIVATALKVQFRYIYLMHFKILRGLLIPTERN